MTNVSPKIDAARAELAVRNLLSAMAADREISLKARARSSCGRHAVMIAIGPASRNVMLTRRVPASLAMAMEMEAHHG